MHESKYLKHVKVLLSRQEAESSHPEFNITNDLKSQMSENTPSKMKTRDFSRLRMYIFANAARVNRRNYLPNHQIVIHMFQHFSGSVPLVIERFDFYLSMCPVFSN